MDDKHLSPMEIADKLADAELREQAITAFVDQVEHLKHPTGPLLRQIGAIWLEYREEEDAGHTTYGECDRLLDIIEQALRFTDWLRDGENPAPLPAELQPARPAWSRALDIVLPWRWGR